jgi:CheY-like chemotaxis protein
LIGWEKLMARILVVEDEEFLLDLYMDLLSGGGHEVDKAADGETALAKMKKGGYDLVLLDLIMPKMGGVEVLEKLKAEKPKKENRVVVFMTNLGKEAIVEDERRFGVKGTITKSDVNPEEFLAEVERYLSGGGK